MEKIYIHQIQESLNEKCWRLSTQLLGQYDINNMSHPWQEYWCIFENQFSTAFENNFFKELIELSALLRALMDTNEIEIPKEFRGISTKVGTLDKGEKEVDLSFREACNKIIHSKEHSFDFSHSENHPLSNGKNGYEKAEIQTFKNPIITTRGVRDTKKWIAKIEFLKFLNQAMNLPED